MKSKKTIIKELSKEAGIDLGVEIKERMNKAIAYFQGKEQLAEMIWKIQPFFYDVSKIWWFWDSKTFRWKIVDETDILNMVSDLSVANTVEGKEKSEILESMRQFGRRKKPQSMKKTWIQFKNIIYDLETDEKFEATPNYFATNPIPYCMGNQGATPTLDKIFEQWVGSDHIQTLYEIIAYCLLPDYPIHRLFCFIGSGMNGKSKFLELLRNFLGEENCCSTELDTLLSSKWEITRLHKKLACQMGETNFSEMKKTSMLKKLSGGDLIGFEYKRKDPFEDTNYAKILISTNSLPATTDKTRGFYRRWLIIDFPNEFTEKKDILSEIPEEEYEALVFKSIAYLRLLLQKREFTNEGSIEERMKKYEDASNPLKKFIEEYCSVGDINAEVTKSQFEKQLNNWLKSTGQRTLSSIEITKRMRNEEFEDGRGYIDWYNGENHSKKLVRIWKGIKFKGNMTDMTDMTGIST